MYLFNLKIFVCLNSRFNFLKSCIAPCNAVNSDCILKVSYFQFVVCLQIHPLAGDIINSKLFLMLCFASLRIVHYSNFSFTILPGRECICKQITHIQELNLN